MALAPAKSPAPSLARAIVRRTRGRTHGPAKRLMSPSDFGEILKPFVFLDLFEHEGAPFNGGLHPPSGIATLTYVVEGAVSYIDPDNVRGTLPAVGVEWMQAGRGMWHGGGLDKAGRTRGFQLWIALPPELTVLAVPSWLAKAARPTVCGMTWPSEPATPPRERTEQVVYLRNTRVSLKEKLHSLLVAIAALALRRRSSTGVPCLWSWTARRAPECSNTESATRRTHASAPMPAG